MFTTAPPLVPKATPFGEEDDCRRDADHDHLRDHQTDRHDGCPGAEPLQVGADQVLVTGHDDRECAVDPGMEAGVDLVDDDGGEGREEDADPGGDHHGVITPPGGGAERSDVLRETTFETRGETRHDCDDSDAGKGPV